MSARFLSGAVPTVTAFDWVPGFAQGFVRDLRVRWALREAGIPYRIELIRQGTQRTEPNLRRQPFGQVPSVHDGERSMFESGAIVWRIAETSEALLPMSEAARDDCLCWVFGALNTVEEPVNGLAFLRLFARDREAAERLLPEYAEMFQEKARRLADALEDRENLVADRFTVADLMMAFVLRGSLENGDLDPFPTLVAYVERHTARHHFRAALEEQLVPFRENAAHYEAAMRARNAGRTTS